MNKKNIIDADKRLIRAKEKDLITKCSMLVKITDKTSLAYYTLIQEIITSLLTIKGIRSSIFNKLKDGDKL